MSLRGRGLASTLVACVVYCKPMLLANKTCLLCFFMYCDAERGGVVFSDAALTSVTNTMSSWTLSRSLVSVEPQCSVKEFIVVVVMAVQVT